MYKDMKVSVIGFGISGVSAINLLAKHNARIFVSDKGASKAQKNLLDQMKSDGKIVDFELGAHSSKVLETDLIVISPGVPRDLEILRDTDIEVISELELGYRQLTTKNIIAVTGTNGKTTTVHLIEHILKYFQNQKDIFLCGNVGMPITEIAESTTVDSFVIIEVSSYQLEWISTFHAKAAAILNITPDHLSRYENINDYANAKFKIFSNQTKNDISILNFDDKFTLGANIFSPKQDFLSFSLEDQNVDIFYDREKKLIIIDDLKLDATKLKLFGLHNIANIMAAILLLKWVLPADKIFGAACSFEGLEHRLEFVNEKDGVKYINDSKSTNIDSTKVALESFELEKNIILLLGGQHKGHSFDELSEIIKKKVKKLILFGEARNRIGKELIKFKNKIEVFPSLGMAINEAKKLAKFGDVVLLSPACSSFDEFENYKQRGEFFKQEII